jgi:hypothetical protein
LGPRWMRMMWRRLHNEELHGLYRSPNVLRVIKSKRLKWAGHVTRMEEGRIAFKILRGTPAGKIPLGRPRRRLKDNIRMDLKEIDVNTKNWVDSTQDRGYWRAFVNATLNLRLPLAMELESIVQLQMKAFSKLMKAVKHIIQNALF